MPSTDKDVEVRGVIVIKTKLKSKAKEKKTALSLWKRVGKRTVQELRKVGGTAAEVRRRYNLFRPKQPTARLRMGKVVQEWNPAPIPVFTNPTAPPAAIVNTPALNAGFDNLLSQVASASGIDIDKPIEVDTVLDGKEKSNNEQLKMDKPPEYNNATVDNNGNKTLDFVPNDQKLQTNVVNQGNLQSSISQQQFQQSGQVTQGVQQTNFAVREEKSLTQGPLHENFANLTMQQTNNQTRGLLQPNQPNHTTQSTQQLNHTTQEMLQFKPITQAILQIPQEMLQSNPVLDKTYQPTTQPNLNINPPSYGIHQPYQPTQGLLSNNYAVQDTLQTNSTVQQGILSNQGEGQRTNMNDAKIGHENMQWEDPSSINFSEKASDVKTHSEQLQPVTLNDEKGISVSIQTRIISTRITKTKTRRRKDSVYPIRNEYSDSSSEKETKKGFLLHRKFHAPGNFTGSNKFKKRRKRNQISYQEKISVDKVSFNPLRSNGNELNKLNKEE